MNFGPKSEKYKVEKSEYVSPVKKENIFEEPDDLILS